VPAGAIENPERTLPRALVLGMIAVTAIYLSATAAVMLLVPAANLAQSSAPFADAARVLGAWGPMFVSAGALVATAGTLNGIIFTCGQMPMAVAIDKLAPAWLAKVNTGGSPHLAVLVSSGLASVFLLMNFSRGLIGALTFLLLMSTAIALIYYFFCALAELRHSWRSASAWAAVAAIACLYTAFAMFGSGLEVLLWGAVLMALGVPLFYLFRHPGRAPTIPVTRPS
jgi:APA family basic amino acid/polyamine antiporter